MKLLATLRSLAANVFRRSAIDGEMDEELRSHIQYRADDLQRSGLLRAEAERRARIEFGGYQRFKEECREALGTHFFESLLQDVRFGLRMLRKAPGFAAIAILTLAIGVGANVAIFSIVNSVLLRPIAYPEPERLVTLWSSSAAIPQYGSSPADIAEWRVRNHVFENLGAFYSAGYYLSAPGQEPERIGGAEVSASLFDVLRVQPALGRNFTAAEEQWGKNHVVLVAHELWQRRFGGDPAILGREIRINGIPYTIVGVLPAGVPFMDNRQRAELFVPMSFAPGDTMATRSNHFLPVVARLAPGVPLERAAAEMENIAAQLAREFPENAGMGIKTVPLQTELVGDTSTTLLVLLAAVGFVLLIACANVAHLMLARATRREREMAVRSALGARRGRLLGQLLTESMLLSVLGVGLGVVLALWALSAGRALLPDALPRFNPIALDVRVLLFAGGVAVLTALLFGSAPALQGTRVDIAVRLKESGTSVTAGQRRSRLRSLLMAGELSVAALLLVCAGLMLKSLQHMLTADPGFDARHVLTFSVPLYKAQYESTQRVVDLDQQIVQRLRAMPGVEAAAFGTDLPLGFGSGWGKLVSFPGRPVPKSRAEVADASFQLVSPEYFRALGTPVLAGREFSDADRASSQQVAIVNSAFARKYFEGQDPIGKTLLMDAPPGLASSHQPGDDPTPVRVIVGMVGDIKDVNLAEPAAGRVFVPVTQFKGEGGYRTGRFCLRVRGEAMAIVPAVRAAVHEFDPDVPLINVRMLEELVGISASTSRFTSLLLAFFAGAALLMAAIGTYGVISNAVAHRTREIGVRIALGATPTSVLRMVLGEALGITVVGMTAGLVLAVLAARMLRSMLYQVRPGDPVIFAMVSGLLVMVALAASYVPARRAMKVDPIVAVRCE